MLFLINMFIVFTPELVEKKAKTTNLKRNVGYVIIICASILLSMLIPLKYIPTSLSNYLNPDGVLPVLLFYAMMFCIPVWLYLHSFSFEKSLIYEKILNDVNAGLSYKTLFQKPPINFLMIIKIIGNPRDLKKIFNYESENPSVNELLDVLRKDYSNINANYVWETPEGLVGVFYYVVSSGKSSSTHYLSLFRSSVANGSAEFAIRKEGFLDKFSKDIEIGDYQFDALLRVFSLNSSSKEEIIKDIHSIGKDKIVDFFNNGGDKLLVEGQFAYWINNISVNEIPTIKYSNKDYHVSDTGINLDEKVIEQNKLAFEDFINRQMFKK